MANGTRLWIYCAPGGSTPLDEGADPNQALNADSLESMAIKSNKDFQEAYAKAGGNNATFVFPSSGNHAWPYWGQQLNSLEARPDRNTQRLRGDQGAIHAEERNHSEVWLTTRATRRVRWKYPRAAYDRWDR